MIRLKSLNYNRLEIINARIRVRASIFVILLISTFTLHSCCKSNNGKKAYTPLSVVQKEKPSSQKLSQKKATPPPKTQKKKDLPLQPISYKIQKASINPKTRRLYGETSRLLAGLKLPKKSRFYKWSVKRTYGRYKKYSHDLWRLFQASNIRKIKRWRKVNLPKNHNTSVFYPFSGPDVINMMAFFPNAQDYIMFGLEKPGVIPKPDKLPYWKALSELWRLHQAMHSILHVNFFKTKKMARNLGSSTFSGTTGIMMFFLAKLEYEVIDVRKIWIDPKGHIVLSTDKRKRTDWIPGVEMSFQKSKNAPIQRIRYFSVNVKNPMLQVHKNFTHFLNRQKSFTTMIKSASYLLHYNSRYSRIRDLILNKSDSILQDDSGVPMGYFTASKWDLTYFGRYIRPIPFFAGRYQGVLRLNMAKHSKGLLPFSYGYAYKRGRSNLIYTNKIKR
ncbi:MAG TPA: hypothetical protein ENI73_05925 [Spirochaetes bacterium]|nr:hypothetical protein [Spirochaetota bacterium]